MALPRLADALPGRFHLLGRGGLWERVTVTANGVPAAHLVGWSFGTRKVQTSPLAAGFPGAADDGLPTFGVLHCDLDVANSDYAPVSRAVLDATGLQGWFLGHIHKPGALTAPHPLGYCGSLVGLDPSETGLHGPWLLTLERGEVRVEQVPLSPLRWECEVVTVPRDAELDLLVLLRDAVDRIHARVKPQAVETRAVGCRIRLVGATTFHAELRRACKTSDPESAVFQRDEIQYFVDRVENATRPAVDLAALASSRDPASALAAQLLALEERSTAADALLRHARDEMQRVAAGKSWLALDNPDLSDDVVRHTLLDAGYEALDALLVQVPSAGSSK